MASFNSSSLVTLSLLTPGIKRAPGGDPGARDLLGYDQNVNVQPKQKLFVAQAAARAVPEMLRVKFDMIGIFTL
jgi:hypothetical protein